MAQNIRNALQAWSNTAAENISAPVDGIAWLLRKAGIPVPANALMGSDWMRERGLTAPVEQGAGQVVGTTLGLLSPAAVQAAAPTLARGLLAVERNALAPSVVNRGGAAGQRGIFMGDMSKTWNKEAAERAAAMEKAGADPRAIWQETGTFKSADGKWRQEIDDSAAKMSGALDEAWISEAYKRGGVDEVKRLADYVPPYLQDGKREVGDVFSHRQLTEAYPWATQNRTYKLDAANPKIGEGSYNPNTGLVSMSRANEPTARSVMLHELQHAVQDAQGFARGGNASEFVGLGQSREAAINEWPFLEQARRKLSDAAKQGKGAVLKLPDGMEMVPREEVGKRMAELDALLMDNPAEKYRRLAGEAEARAVQSRMGMTAAERRAKFPLDSYDVPLNSLIVR